MELKSTQGTLVPCQGKDAVLGYVEEKSKPLLEQNHGLILIDDVSETQSPLNLLYAFGSSGADRVWPIPLGFEFEKTGWKQVDGKGEIKLLFLLSAFLWHFHPSKEYLKTNDDGSLVDGKFQFKDGHVGDITKADGCKGVIILGIEETGLSNKAKDILEAMKAQKDTGKLKALPIDEIISDRSKVAFCKFASLYGQIEIKGLDLPPKITLVEGNPGQMCGGDLTFTNAKQVISGFASKISPNDPAFSLRGKYKLDPMDEDTPVKWAAGLVEAQLVQALNELKELRNNMNDPNFFINTLRPRMHPQVFLTAPAQTDNDGDRSMDVDEGGYDA